MAKLFQNKETAAEETAEATALKKGKITTGQYVKGEMSEGDSKRDATKKANDLKSGKMSVKEYAAPNKMADGGMCGYRSPQDYGKKK